MTIDGQKSRIIESMKKGLILVALIAAGIAAFWAVREFASGTKVDTGRPHPPVIIDVAAVRAKAEGGDAPAQAQLGRLYTKGEGVTNSYTEAVKWYRLAADQGNSDAQFGLGELYDAGQGVKQDPTEAVKWYRLAAEQGNAGAQYTLGFLYESGRSVAQDQAQATKWFRLAAEQGDALSQYDLGQRFELGIGTTADRVEALKWFLLAAVQNQADSVKRAATLQGNLSREEVAEAKRRVSAFSPKSGNKP
jgi:TPR repeat protein